MRHRKKFILFYNRVEHGRSCNRDKSEVLSDLIRWIKFSVGNGMGKMGTLMHVGENVHGKALGEGSLAVCIKNFKMYCLCFLSTPIFSLPLPSVFFPPQN